MSRGRLVLLVVILLGAGVWVFGLPYSSSCAITSGRTRIPQAVEFDSSNPSARRFGIGIAT